MRLFFDPAKTGTWDAVSLRPDADSKYTVLDTVMKQLGCTGKASVEESTGRAVIEIAYDWTAIRPAGAPKVGETAPEETDAAPAAEAGSAPVGAIAAILAGVALVIGIVTARMKKEICSPRGAVRSGTAPFLDSAQPLDNRGGVCYNSLANRIPSAGSQGIRGEFGENPSQPSLP